MNLHTRSNAVLALLCMLTLFNPAAANAYHEKVLYSFAGGADGALPQSTVLKDSQGNLYGTAQSGGGTGCGGGGCGIVFEIAPDGQETILHDFDGDDGAFPVTGLVQDTAGNLYGAAINGGGSKCVCGVIFKVTPDGQESALHAFTGHRDGAFPLGNLIADGTGNLYGTTSGGGRKCGCGTVFKLTLQGEKTVLHAFAGGKDGDYPAAVLLREATGNLYGTTANGGIDCDGTGFGCGTVFKIGTDGRERVLYAFEGGSHGANPTGGVIMDATGTIYGTTNNGGVDCEGSGADCGTVFRLAPDGAETGLHVFQGGAQDGAFPRGGLVMGGGGNFYGTTSEGGGPNDAGLVFRITPEGDFSIAHAFSGGKDGGGPFAALMMDASGTLYGTTYYGGRFSNGTVFRLQR